MPGPPLRRNQLKDVSRPDVHLRPFHHRFVLGSADVGSGAGEVRLAPDLEGGTVEGGQPGAVSAKLPCPLLQLLHSLPVTIQKRRFVGGPGHPEKTRQHDPLFQMVENQHAIAKHQMEIPDTAPSFPSRERKKGFRVTGRLKGDVPHRSSQKGGITGVNGGSVSVEQILQHLKGIRVDPFCSALSGQGHLPLPAGDDQKRIRPDKRISGPFFAAFHALQKKGIGSVAPTIVQGYRRHRVDKNRLAQGNR